MIAGAGLGRQLESDADAVPGIHQRDGVGEVGNLLVVVVSFQRLVGCIRGVRYVDVDQGLSPFKRSFLGFREIGAVSPSGQAIETFV
jgi:hypothetical protein